MPVLVIGEGIWGKGDSLTEAMANAKKQNGNRAVKQYIAVASSDPDIALDDAGFILFRAEYGYVEIDRKPALKDKAMAMGFVPLDAQSLRRSKTESSGS